MIFLLKVHPRFAIGESTTPMTTMDIKKLSLQYNIPELANVSSYLGMKDLNLTTWPKEVKLVIVHAFILTL